MYGSFASIPIFLIWILVLWWICLAGVALTATLEKGRADVARSDGEEAPSPLGDGVRQSASGRAFGNSDEFIREPAEENARSTQKERA